LTVALATAPPENPEPVHPHKATHRKPAATKPSAPADVIAQTADKTAQPAQPAQTQAANGAGSEVSAIGQLSSSGGATTPPGRQDVERLINNTENGLINIKRTLNSDEQVTSTQIKTFLVKAKEALADNDLDGAQTLANKAKVLLEELTKK